MESGKIIISDGSGNVVALNSPGFGSGKILGEVGGVPAWVDPPATSSAGEIPVGGIIPWWPPTSTSTPPAGFKLCDGQLINNLEDFGTPFYNKRVPNLVGKFVRGYGSAQGGDAGVNNANVNKGGTDSHNHTGTTSFSTLGNFTGIAGGSALTLVINSHNHSFTTSSSNNVPAYVGLKYIIRIK